MDYRHEKGAVEHGPMCVCEDYGRCHRWHLGGMLEVGVAGGGVNCEIASKAVAGFWQSLRFFLKTQIIIS